MGNYKDCSFCFIFLLLIAVKTCDLQAYAFYNYIQDILFLKIALA